MPAGLQAIRVARRALRADRTAANEYQLANMLGGCPAALLPAAAHSGPSPLSSHRSEPRRRYAHAHRVPFAPNRSVARSRSPCGVCHSRWPTAPPSASKQAQVVRDAASASLVAVRRKPERHAVASHRALSGCCWVGFSDEAVYHYEQAVALNPTHVDALHNLGAANTNAILCSTLACLSAGSGAHRAAHFGRCGLRRCDPIRSAARTYVL